MADRTKKVSQKQHQQQKMADRSQEIMNDQSRNVVYDGHVFRRERGKLVLQPGIRTVEGVRESQEKYGGQSREVLERLANERFAAEKRNAEFLRLAKKRKAEADLESKPLVENDNDGDVIDDDAEEDNDETDDYRPNDESEGDEPLLGVVREKGGRKPGRNSFEQKSFGGERTGKGKKTRKRRSLPLQSLDREPRNISPRHGTKAPTPKTVENIDLTDCLESESEDGDRKPAAKVNPKTRKEEDNRDHYESGSEDFGSRKPAAKVNFNYLKVADSRKSEGRMKSSEYGLKVYSEKRSQDDGNYDDIVSFGNMYGGSSEADLLTESLKKYESWEMFEAINVGKQRNPTFLEFLGKYRRALIQAKENKNVYPANMCNERVLGTTIIGFQEYCEWGIEVMRATNTKIGNNIAYLQAVGQFAGTL